MSTNNNIQDFKIDDKLKDLVRAKGQKLGIILSELKIDDETRQAFLDILPSLTLEQIDELLNTLEVKYLDAATRSEDEKFKQDLLKIKNDFEKAQEQNDLKTLKQLEDLENILENKK